VSLQVGGIDRSERKSPDLSANLASLQNSTPKSTVEPDFMTGFSDFP
jgi:hypothetical protein